MSNYHVFRFSTVYQSTLKPRLLQQPNGALEVELELFGAVKGRESIILSYQTAKNLADELAAIAKEIEDKINDPQFG